MVKVSNIRGLFLLVTIGCVLGSCLDKKEYDETPEISIEGYNLIKAQSGKDSVMHLFIHYTDGDGNIGLTQGDTVAPYVGQYYYNCFLEYYELQNGQWELINLPLPFYYRIPPLEEDGKDIEGVIDVRLSSPFFSPSQYDTIKFSVKIVDRDLNESNLVETGPIVVDK